MKILKIFGLVVGIHVFALILIFANPGCSSTTKPPPTPADTVASNPPPPTISMPAPAGASPIAPAPINFNPDAPATAAPTGNAGVRFTPTRPNSPAAATLVAEPVADVTPATTYAVKSNDSLWSIAKRNHISVSELAAANNLKSNAVLHEGQKLIIPGKPASPAAAATASPAAASPKTAETIATKATAAGGTLKHTVKSGETLSTIAKKYDVKQGDIAVANNITDPKKIRPGMELIIPGYKAVEGKGGSAPKSGGTGGKSAPAPKPAEIPTIGPVDSAPKPGPGEIPVIKVDEGASAPATPPKG